MEVESRAHSLLADARATNERRVLVLSGSHQTTLDTCYSLLESLPVGISETMYCGDADTFHCPSILPRESKQLMGTTQSVIILDLFATTEPNVLGRVSGAVDGGGLLILLCNPPDTFESIITSFEQGLAVQPYSTEDVGSLFKRRLKQMLLAHDGIEWIDCETNAIIAECERGGSNESPDSRELSYPPDHTFSPEAYDACLTQGQVTALGRFERLQSANTVIQLSADRGRGKSSIAGIAAGALAELGLAVGITAPRHENVQALIARIGEQHGSWNWEEGEQLSFASGGSIQFFRPIGAQEAIQHRDIDCLLVDEAAGIPVPVLESYLALDRLAFCTTLHGYEGTGQGFATKFQSKLSAHEGDIYTISLTEPIRYAPDDPIERWVTHTLLLDASPPVGSVVTATSPDTISITQLKTGELAANEILLKHILGLLATAHYRTEPNDLARLLDAPNMSLFAALHDGFPIGVALIAKEGGIQPDRFAEIDEGKRLRGHMIPEMCYMHTRSSRLGESPGNRIVRIATHQAVRRRGIGSMLINYVRNAIDASQWLGTGFGAQPDVIAFWASNGFVPAILSTTRNETSGNFSVVMLDQESTTLPIIETHTDGFTERFAATLTDSHRTLDPATVRAIIKASRETYPIQLTETERDILRVAAAGIGTYTIDPRGAKTLLLRTLSDPTVTNPLDDADTALLITKILQGHPWDVVKHQGGYPSVRTCRMAIGDALGKLWEHNSMENHEQ